MSWRIAGLYQSTGIVPRPSTAPPGFLLDIYPNAAFAYSFRKLRAAYSGSAVRIRASGDNAESDFGFDGNGDFDAAGVASFLTTHGGTGFIVTWYDQSGNGVDITQATAADQPAYVASGIGGLPGIQYTANTQRLAHANFLGSEFGTGTQGTLFAVHQQDGTEANNKILIWSADTLFNIWATFGDNNLYWDFGSGGAAGRVSAAQPTGWDDTPHVVECYRDSGDEQGIVVDGVSLVTGSRTDDINPVHSGTLSFDVHVGFKSEVVWWGTDLGATDRAGARTNINSYYF